MNMIEYFEHYANSVKTNASRGNNLKTRQNTCKLEKNFFFFFLVSVGEMLKQLH